LLVPCWLFLNCCLICPDIYILSFQFDYKLLEGRSACGLHVCLKMFSRVNKYVLVNLRFSWMVSQRKRIPSPESKATEKLPFRWHDAIFICLRKDVKTVM
jgi:hypothetical protein